ncbi:MAG: phosphatase PAP2 family protein [Patescibacteria group bacterium]|nr:phosphatase PAP2 family protein [Patescibacteria group bacterium]
MNISLFYFLYGFAFKYQWLDSLIRFTAVDLIYIVLVLVVIYIIYKYKMYDLKNISTILRSNIKGILLIPFTAALALGIAKIVKLLVHTDRPMIALSNIHTLFTENGYAFPSGHSTVISAIAFSLFFQNKKLGYIGFVVALFIGAARVMGGVHFPIDILGGYIIGFLVAFFVKTI